MTDLTPTIPAARLALLDTALLYGGSHRGGPDCRHCARELLHEIVTGEHRDAPPPGCTAWTEILPGLNDGPWRDDVHRTEVLRPYLPRFLPPTLGGLDPARDEARVYAVLDWCYRDALPEIFELPNEAARFRALPEIVDRDTAGLALDLAIDIGLAPALTINLTLTRDRDLDRDLTLTRLVLARLILALAPSPETWERIVLSLLDRICAVS